LKLKSRERGPSLGRKEKLGTSTKIIKVLQRKEGTEGDAARTDNQKQPREGGGSGVHTRSESKKKAA